MRRNPLLRMFLTLIILLASPQDFQVQWERAPDLPVPVANNAVAGGVIDGGPMVFSVLGIDSTKQFDGIVNSAFRWRPGAAAWERLPDIPGPPRLAATAQVVGGRLYVFGGYTVGGDGSEQSRPGVYRFDPGPGEWSEMAPMPVPVDDAVSGVWRDSLIYIISGWHDRDNVRAVQIFDPASNLWQEGTPIPGQPVFGHAGAIAGDMIVYLDGVRTRVTRPRFVIESSAWLGRIDPGEPAGIVWKRVVQHPGPPLYRAAAGSSGDLVIFAGGTDNPYNYDGNGYDGVPSVPRAGVFAINVRTEKWMELEALPAATMDHRGLVVLDSIMIVAGGMAGDRQVTSVVHLGRIGGHRRRTR